MEGTRLTWADEIILRNELQTRREDIRHLIQRKFGEAPAGVDAVIGSAGTDDEITALFDRAIFARIEDDLLQTS